MFGDHFDDAAAVGGITYIFCQQLFQRMDILFPDSL